MVIPNIFDPIQFAPNDASVNYLYAMFGSMTGVIVPNAPLNLPQYYQVIFGNMFSTFNTTILAVGALVVLYTTIVGVMNTAHQGQFMGKDWNNLWIPIRTVLGISMLVPTATGYSYIQVFMMWFIIQGIGAADSLWSTMLQTMSGTFTNPYGNIVAPATQARQTVTELFKSLVCAESSGRLMAATPNPYTGVNGSSASGNDNSYYCNANPSNGTCAGLPPFPPLGSTSWALGPDGACGEMTVCDPVADCAGNSGSMACLACTAQLAQFANFIQVLQPIADAFVKADYDYQKYYYATNNPNSPPAGGPPGFVQDYCTAKHISPCSGKSLPSPLGDTSNAPNNVVDDIYLPYMKSLLASASTTPGAPASSSTSLTNGANFFDTLTTQYETAMKGAITDFHNNVPANVNDRLKTALSTGWILAGSYYQVLASMNNSLQKESSPPISMSRDTSDSGGRPTTLNHYRTSFDAADRLVNDLSGMTNVGTTKSVAPIGAAAQSSANDLAKNAQTVFGNNPNPLLQLTIAGYAMLMIAQVFYLVMLVVAALSGASTISIFVFGSGIDNPLGRVWEYLYMFIIPLIWFVLGILVTLGATLGVYLPLVPYIIFTMGALGWLISTIEAMIAGPLVALGILMPSHHHELLGEAKPALMLLFNIFLRPSLMIFGLMSAIILSNVAVIMVNTGFGTVVRNLFDFAGTGETGGQVAAGFNPLAMLFVLIAYVTLLIVVLNKCFAAIHIIPERVMRWIGGQGEQYGEGEALGEVKGAVSQGAGQAQKAMEGGIKSGAEAKSKNDGKTQGGGADVGGQGGGGSGGGKSGGGGSQLK